MLQTCKGFAGNALQSHLQRADSYLLGSAAGKQATVRPSRWPRKAQQHSMATQEDSAAAIGTGVHLAQTDSWEGSQSGSFKRIAVFCGASAGSTPEYLAAARALGAEFVRRGIRLVYGGGNIGLMGAIAEAVYAGLGEGSVIGVIPAALQPREISGHSIGELRIVEDMHTRKAMMSAEADAFIAIPGGFGTLEELLEMVTWQQLGLHCKPVGVLNMHGFYDHLLAFFDHCVQEGFVRPSSRNIVQEAADPASLIDKLEAYEAPVSILQLGREGKLSCNIRG